MQVIDQYGTDITDRELSAMPYTTALVKETLRHKAIVSSVWRKTLVDIELGGYRIPKVRVIRQSKKNQRNNIRQLTACLQNDSASVWLHAMVH